jgi:hypothetical protein
MIVQDGKKCKPHAASRPCAVACARRPSGLRRKRQYPDLRRPGRQAFRRVGELARSLRVVVPGQLLLRREQAIPVADRDGECRNWVINAIGAPTQIDAKADKELLKPLPERAVWMAPGVPKTGASMFSQRAAIRLARARPGNSLVPGLVRDGYRLADTGEKFI